MNNTMIFSIPELQCSRLEMAFAKNTLNILYILNALRKTQKLPQNRLYK